MRKKISIIYLGKRGAGPVYSCEFVQALLANNINIQAFVSIYSENINTWRTLRKRNNLELHEVKTFRNKFDFFINTFNLSVYLDISLKIKEFHPDAILLTMVHPWHNIILQFCPSKIKVVKVIHDVIPHSGENSILHKILSYIDLKKADNYIVLTEVAKKHLLLKGVSLNNILVIPHANFLAYNKPLSKGNNLIYRRIAFFGRINKYKGLENLLIAFASLRKKIPSLKLSIIGSGDCSIYRNYIEENSDAIEVHNRWIEETEVALLLKNVDIVILPYNEATQSGVIPLAYSLGKPVIATNVGGLAEQVNENIGILIEPNNINAIEDAITNLYENPSIIKKLGENAWIYANTELSWDKSAKLLLDYLY